MATTAISIRSYKSEYAFQFALSCLQICTRSVALTVPAYTAADLVRRDCPDASMALKSLDYPPVAAVTVSYPMSAIKQDRLDEARKLPGKAKLLCCYTKALLF